MGERRGSRQSPDSAMCEVNIQMLSVSCCVSSGDTLSQRQIFQFGDFEGVVYTVTLLSWK